MTTNQTYTYEDYDIGGGMKAHPQLTTTQHVGLNVCIASSGKEEFVRATLPPSTLFADRALLRRGYSISDSKALVETVSKYKGLH